MLVLGGLSHTQESPFAICLTIICRIMWRCCEILRTLPLFANKTPFVSLDDDSD